MGLDMYAYQMANKPDTEVDFAKSEFRVEEIYYWRGHRELHHWMRDLYLKKGGTNTQFNGNTLLLTMEDLMNLKRAIDDNEFITSDPKEYHLDLAFVENAAGAIAVGNFVFYDSSW